MFSVGFHCFQYVSPYFSMFSGSFTVFQYVFSMISLCFHYVSVCFTIFQHVFSIFHHISVCFHCVSVHFTVFQYISLFAFSAGWGTPLTPPQITWASGVQPAGNRNKPRTKEILSCSHNNCPAWLYNASNEMCIFLIFYFDFSSSRQSRKPMTYGGKNVMIMITFRCYFSQGELLEI